MRRMFFVGALALLCALALPGFKKATMRLPEVLAGVAPIDVVGHQVRTPTKPMTFGDFRVGSVKEAAEFSWSTEAFGVRGGSAKHRYRFVLETPEAETLEVECRSRSIEAWRGGWKVELTDAFKPRLACGLRGGDRELRLILGSRGGNSLRGLVEAPGKGPFLEVNSVHRLDGSPLPLEQPAGYVLERGGFTVAAVETINRGRVWLVPGLDAETRGTAAAVAAALLFYKPDLAVAE